MTGGDVGFSKAVRTCLRKYVTFSGRATRPEYWYFVLFGFLGIVILSIFDYLLFGGTVETTARSVEVQSNGPLASLFNLVMFVPGLAAGWRRMHDSGRSGLFLLYPLIVMVGIGMYLGFWAGLARVTSGDLGALVGGVGGIIALVSILVMILSPLIVLWWLTRPSQPGDNEYGSI